MSYCIRLLLVLIQVAKTRNFDKCAWKSQIAFLLLFFQPELWFSLHLLPFSNSQSFMDLLLFCSLHFVHSFFTDFWPNFLDHSSFRTHTTHVQTQYQPKWVDQILQHQFFMQTYGLSFNMRSGTVMYEVKRKKLQQQQKTHLILSGRRRQHNITLECIAHATQQCWFHQTFAQRLKMIDDPSSFWYFQSHVLHALFIWYLSLTLLSRFHFPC